MNLSSEIFSSRPYIISGPCSVETEDQINKVVIEIAREGKTSIIRGGIWKPRTRPDSFEGVGEVGLKWLKNSASSVNLPCAIEVANAKHVELALKEGIDVLWIGARTTVNPFAVQEISDSLRGVNIPIMIKNPMNPDLNLWIGAFERMQQAGVSDLIAIHRGFSVYKHDTYRNVPNWEIPIALKQEMPSVPLLCDPSHIAGKKDLLLEVSQKAMDLNYNGLMLESHSNPELAWSDPRQQISPKQVTALLSNLILRSVAMEEQQFNELDSFRNKVAELDEELFELLAKRMELSQEIGIFKKKHNITILQEEHWKRLLESRMEIAKKLNLSNDFIRAVLDAIHLESITRQISVMNK
jgi:chorismate mutase